MKPLSPRLLREFVDLAREAAGIEMGEDKESLVASRLQKRMRKLGLLEFEDYHALLTGPKGGEELEWFINILTTNVTSFFRENEAFHALAERLRKGVAHGGWRVRIWCAAASTGEEPYSLAIVAREALEGMTSDIRILATDIDTTVLGKAARGVFDEERMAPVSRARRERWFRPHADGGWEVRPELRELVSFARLNLAQTPFPMRGPFHAIFCRNVMIYFGREVRQGILDEAGRLLDHDGMFAVGRSEGLAGLRTELAYVAPAVYARAGRVRGAA